MSNIQTGSSMRMWQTTQSQVMTNPDLLRQIFDYFYVWPKRKRYSGPGRMPAPESKHLLWTALACKAFYEPAMDVLWRCMDSWTAFLRVIPTILLENDASTYTTTRVMTKSSMQRLLSYTKRVRNLTIKKFSESVSAHINFSMSQFCRMDTLFPALAALYIPELSQLSPDNIYALYLSTSPNLSVLKVSGITTATEIVAASVLSHHLPTAPSLRKLSLCGKLTQAVLDLLVGLANLESIHFNVVDTTFTADFLKKLSQLRSLETLTICSANNSRIESTPTSAVMFESVRKIVLSGSANNIYNFLQSIRFAHLDNLLLEFLSDSLVPSIQSCLSRCSELGILPALIFFVVGQVPNPKVALLELDSSVVLHSCKNLQHLDIPVLSMTKSTIRNRFRECELLKILRLQCYQLPANDTGLFLHDLREFAEHFRNLRKLAVSLADILESANDAQMLETSLADPLVMAGHNLEELEILPIDTRATHLSESTKTYTYKEAIVVSQYIDSLFPRLKKLDFPAPANPWSEEVKALVKAHQAVRKRERELAKKWFESCVQYTATDR